MHAAARAADLDSLARRAGGRSLPLPWMLVGLCLFAWGLAFQGSRSLWDADEGRYTAVALEMLEHGDYVVPRLHPESVHVTKPPLTYWAIAGSLELFGRNEWAVRLPNTLAFTLTGLVLLAVGRRLVPRRPWLPPLVYAASAFPFAAEGIVTTDTLLALWETAAIACYVAALGEPRTRQRRAWIVAMWIAFGVAFLTKGPPGILPLAALALFTVLASPSPLARDLPRLFSWVGIPAFALVSLTWFFAAERRLPGLLEHLLNFEVVDRVASDELSHHPQWWGALAIYVPVFLLGTLPWTPTCYAALRATRFSLRPSAWRAAAARDPELALLVCWLVVPLIVFMLARSRLPLYVLPLFAPLSLLVARRLDARDALVTTRHASLLAGWAVLLLAAKVAAAHVTVHRDARDYAAYLTAVATGPFDEVVFVEMHRHHGLHFYLGVEVECIRIAGVDRSDEFAEASGDLAEELREPERRLFVVTDRKSDAFRGECERLGAHARLLGQRLDELIYAVEPAAGPPATTATGP